MLDFLEMRGKVVYILRQLTNDCNGVVVMEITEKQRDMLISLLDTIDKTWGITIGYSCVHGSFISGNEDFVIYEEGDLDSQTHEVQNLKVHLLHRLDFEHDVMGFMSRTTKKEFLCADDKAQEFMGRVNRALMDGEISFPPGITRVYRSPATAKILELDSDGSIVKRDRGFGCTYTVTLTKVRDDTFSLDICCKYSKVGLRFELSEIYDKNCVRFKRLDVPVTFLIEMVSELT